jgi:2-hydroxy-6-oxonona-2,4-dienedioate hydrolase
MPELTLKDTSRQIDTPEGKLHYHEAGDGPPLLLLHGSGPGVSSWANYRGNMGVFAEHFRVLALDFPGFGRSYSPDANPVMAAPGAVTSFLDALGLESVAIVGNSMGGGVAAQVAASQPERVSRLVTIGGVGVPIFSASPPEGIKLLVEFVDDPTRDRLVKWMESMVYDTSLITEEFVQMRWEQATDPEALDGIRRMYNQQLLANFRLVAGNPASLAMLPKIQAPTLLTWGRDDRVTPMDGALGPMRFIPRCELHVFYDCGHWAMIERKDEFESVVLSFLLRDVTS